MSNTQVHPVELRPPVLDWRRGLGLATASTSSLLMTLLIIAITTGICLSLDHPVVDPFVDVSAQAMIYLLAIAVIASRYGWFSSIIGSIISAAVFDFIFCPPRFQISLEPNNIVTCIVMMLVGLLIGHLTATIQEQAQAARTRERQTKALYVMTQQLGGAEGIDQILDVSQAHLNEMFPSRCLVFLPDERAQSLTCATKGQTILENETKAAAWVFAHPEVQVAGQDSAHVPRSDHLFFPLMGSRACIGVMGIKLSRPYQDFAADERQLLEAFIHQTALAIERENLSVVARESQVKVKTEQLRNAVLSSVSHDLRTPLSIIRGASRNVLEQCRHEAPDRKLIRDNAQTIDGESERLGRLVSNLLEISRIESGAMTINRQAQQVEEVIGSALHHLEKALGSRSVHTHVPIDLPLVVIDSVLIDQVLVNLLENAIRYTPVNSPIEISATREENRVMVEVADRGPGLAPGEEEEVFGKFFRGREGSACARGSGLGLPICRGIVEAHGCRIWAQNRQPDEQGRRGASFRFTLPIATDDMSTMTMAQA